MIYKLAVSGHEAQAFDPADGQQKPVERVVSVGPGIDLGDGVVGGDWQPSTTKLYETLLDLRDWDIRFEFALAHLDGDLPQAGNAGEDRLLDPFELEGGTVAQ